MANEETLKREEEALRKLMELKSDYTSVLQEESKQVLEYTRVKKALAAAEEAGAENVAELRETVETYRLTLSDTEKEILEMTEAIDSQSESLKKQREELAKSEKRIRNFKRGLDALTNSNISSIMSLEGFAENVIKVAFSLRDAGTDLGRATGFFSTFRDNVIATTERNRQFGITIAETTQIIGGLSNGMARFNMLGDEQQYVLQDISARFLRLGVDAKDFGEALDTINFSFGMTGQVAAEAAKSLESVASQVGRPLSSVINDLNDIGPSLARFGRDGLRVFSELSVQARELGLTTKQAFDVSELFDTFEGAAQIAGRLNAQLGLQLNSVELMKASSEDRLVLLREEFQLQGLQFESMGRRQRQMIASILGQDEETAARLLGDRMDISAFQKEPEEKTIGDMVKAQEIMTGLMEQIALPLAKYLERTFKWAQDNWGNISKYLPILQKISIGIIALKGVGMLRGLLGNVGGAGLMRGAGGAIARMNPVGRAALLASTVAGGAGLIAGGGDDDSFGRNLATGLGGFIGGFAPVIAGALGAVPTGGLSLGAGIAAATAGGAAGAAGGGALYDAIFGAPQAPRTSNAAMARATDPSRRSAGNMNLPNITVNLTSKLDGTVLDQRTVDVMNNKLTLTSPN